MCFKCEVQYRTGSSSNGITSLRSRFLLSQVVELYFKFSTFLKLMRKFFFEGSCKQSNFLVPAYGEFLNVILCHPTRINYYD